MTQTRPAKGSTTCMVQAQSPRYPIAQIQFQSTSTLLKLFSIDEDDDDNDDDYNDDVDDKDNNDDNDERMSITKVGGKAIRWSQSVTWRAF